MKQSNRNRSLLRWQPNQPTTATVAATEWLGWLCDSWMKCEQICMYTYYMHPTSPWVTLFLSPCPHRPNHWRIMNEIRFPSVQNKQYFKWLDLLFAKSMLRAQREYTHYIHLYVNARSSGQRSVGSRKGRETAYHTDQYYMHTSPSSSSSPPLR